MLVPQLQELTVQCIPFNPALFLVQPQALQKQPGCRQKLPLGQGAEDEEQ